MAKKNVGVLLPVVCISAALYASCSADTASMFSILEGTVSWARKDWTGATTAFLGVADAEPDAVRDSVREYAVYALASVYLSQEEYNAALQRLSSVSDAAPEGLQSSKWYQAGVIAFRKGLFEDAASYFRKSLEADASSVDAKVNLELSQRSLSSANTPRAAGSAGFQEKAGDAADTETLFDYIRQKEEQRWKSIHETAEQQNIADH